MSARLVSRFFLVLGASSAHLAHTQRSFLFCRVVATVLSMYVVVRWYYETYARCLVAFFGIFVRYSALILVHIERTYDVLFLVLSRLWLWLILIVHKIALAP